MAPKGKSPPMSDIALTAKPGGTIAVAEVLYGNPPERSLALRQIIPCNWSGSVHCDVRLWFSKPRAYPDTLTEPGIWFLKRVSDGTWRPSAIFGFDALAPL